MFTNKEKNIYGERKIIDRGQLQWNVMIIKVFHDNVEDQYLNDLYIDLNHYLLDQEF
jgi:hypothetical protein